MGRPRNIARYTSTPNIRDLIPLPYVSTALPALTHRTRSITSNFATQAADTSVPAMSAFTPAAEASASATNNTSSPTDASAESTGVSAQVSTSSAPAMDVSSQATNAVTEAMDVDGETTDISVQATSALGIEDAPQDQTGILAKKRKPSTTLEAQPAKESRKTSDTMASDTFQHSDSDLESIAADIPGHVEYGNKVYPGTSATGTILDDYEEADQEDYKQYDHVYVIKKTYGRLENPTAVATDKPKVTTVGSFRGLRDANECAEAYLEQGRYAGIVWKKWEVETEHSDGLVNILATSDSHWYRVQVLRKQKGTDKPYIYLVEEVRHAEAVLTGERGNDPEMIRIHQHIDIYNNRHEANARVIECVDERMDALRGPDVVLHPGRSRFSRASERCVHKQTMDKGCLEHQIIVRQLSSMPGEGDTYIIRTRRMPFSNNYPDSLSEHDSMPGLESP